MCGMYTCAKVLVFETFGLYQLVTPVPQPRFYWRNHGIPQNEANRFLEEKSGIMEIVWCKQVVYFKWNFFKYTNTIKVVQLPVTRICRPQWQPCSQWISEKMNSIHLWKDFFKTKNAPGMCWMRALLPLQPSHPVTAGTSGVYHHKIAAPSKKLSPFGVLILGY